MFKVQIVHGKVLDLNRAKGRSCCAQITFDKFHQLRRLITIITFIYLSPERLAIHISSIAIYLPNGEQGKWKKKQ